MRTITKQRIDEFIEKHTISDQETINKVHDNRFPKGWLFKPLVPIGYEKYVGDNFKGTPLANWSQNDKFNIGEYYPIYEGEQDIYHIGNDGRGYKIVPKAWTGRYFFN